MIRYARHTVWVDVRPDHVQQPQVTGGGRLDLVMHTFPVIEKLSY